MTTTERIIFKADTREAIAGFAKIQQAGDRVASKFQGIGGSLTSFGAKASLATAPLVAGLGLATQKAADFDTAMSGASRALDLSTKETEAFKNEALKIAPALGLAPTKFAELATEAGKLGVAKDKIIGFATVVAEIAAITDLTAQETQKLASSFAALQTITGASTEELNIYGAAVNKLDDSIGGTTPNIIEFTRQTAASGKLLKLGIKDLAAYGSTMQSLGIQNGVAYRSFNALLTKLAAPQTLSKKAKEAFSELGISVSDMSKIMTRDANAGINEFLTRLKQLSETDVSAALGVVKEVVGQDYGDEILTLALSTHKLDEALGAVGDTMDKANLAKKADELQKKLGTMKGQQAILNAQMERLGIIIGSAVLPSVTDLLGMLTPLIEKVADFAQQHPGLTKVALAIAAIGVSVGPVAAILGTTISAFGKLALLLPALKAGLGAAAIAFGAITAPMWGVIAVSVALGAAIGVLIAYWDKVKLVAGKIPEVFRVATALVQSYWNNAVANIKYAIARISNSLSGLPRWAFDTGVSLMSNFAQGIYNAITAPVRAIAWVVDRIRAYLPSSPAKIGPLSDLDQTGSGMMRTFAQTISPDPVTDRLDRALSQATMPRQSPTAIAPNSSRQSPMGSLVVNDNRTINIGTSDIGREGIIEALKKSDRELLDLLDKARARWQRGT